MLGIDKKIVLKFNVFCFIDDDTVQASSNAMEEMIIQQLEIVMERLPGKRRQLVRCIHELFKWPDVNYPGRSCNVASIFNK